jgi:hypothetical protein
MNACSTELADERGAAFAGWPRAWIPACAGMTNKHTASTIHSFTTTSKAGIHVFVIPALAAPNRRLIGSV